MHPKISRLVNVGEDLSTGLAVSMAHPTLRACTHVLPSGLLVVHDARRGGEDDLSERSSGEQQVDPVLNGIDTDVESGRDDTGLVESAVELDDDLAASVVVNDLELSDVAYC